jgi:hypothetical protein
MFGPKIILDHLSHLYNFLESFEKGTSDPEDLLTIADIEALYLEYQSRLSETDFSNLINLFSKIKGEEAIIQKKKNEYLEIGIRLKKFHFFKSSILTKIG